VYSDQYNTCFHTRGPLPSHTAPARCALFLEVSLRPINCRGLSTTPQVPHRPDAALMTALGVTRESVYRPVVNSPRVTSEEFQGQRRTGGPTELQKWIICQLHTRLGKTLLTPSTAFIVILAIGVLLLLVFMTESWTVGDNNNHHNNHHHIVDCRYSTDSLNDCWHGNLLLRCCSLCNSRGKRADHGPGIKLGQRGALPLEKLPFGSLELGASVDWCCTCRPSPRRIEPDLGF
jgi:hypothetical protein